jgi:hypothetical protein
VDANVSDYGVSVTIVPPGGRPVRMSTMDCREYHGCGEGERSDQAGVWGEDQHEARTGAAEVHGVGFHAVLEL